MTGRAGSPNGAGPTLVGVNARAAAQPPPPPTSTTSAPSGFDGNTEGRDPTDRAGAPRAESGRAQSERRTDRGAVLDRGAAERVLRRAVQLDSDDADVGQRVSVQALLEAADELGIDRAEVRRAVVEEELGLLREEPRRSDVLLGPERFVAARVIDGVPDEVSERIDAWLRRSRVLRRSRRPVPVDDSAGWVEYTRRTDPVAGAQRALHALQGSERLAHVSRVRVVVGALDEHRSVVGLLVDASRSRSNAAAGGSALAATGAAGSIAGLGAVAGIWPAAIGVAAASVAAGAGVMLGRKSYTADVDDELESVLDAVASGESPPSVIDGVTSRLLRPTRPARP